MSTEAPERPRCWECGQPLYPEELYVCDDCRWDGLAQEDER